MDVIEDVSSCAREDSNNGLGGMGSIPLSSMPQQAEVLAPEDDWTGLSSPAARRKLQNRLNQRAYSKFALEDLHHALRLLQVSH